MTKELKTKTKKWKTENQLLNKEIKLQMSLLVDIGSLLYTVCSILTG